MDFTGTSNKMSSDSSSLLRSYVGKPHIFSMYFLLCAHMFAHELHLMSGRTNQLHRFDITQNRRELRCREGSTHLRSQRADGKRVQRCMAPQPCRKLLGMG